MVTLIHVPGPLRQKLGEDATEALVKLLNETQESAQKTSLEFATERFERRLTEEVSKLRADMSKMFSDLAGEIQKTKAQLILWFVTLWAGGALTLTLTRLLR